MRFRVYLRDVKITNRIAQAFVSALPSRQRQWAGDNALYAGVNALHAGVNALFAGFGQTAVLVSAALAFAFIASSAAHAKTGDRSEAYLRKLKQSPSFYCNYHFTGRNSNLQAIRDADTEKLSSHQKVLISEMRQFLRQEEDTVRISRAASRIRFHKDETGQVRTDLPVTIIFHGLLNSPSWFQKMENTAFAGGSHVLNIRLPGHYTKRPRDLDQVTADEWMNSVREALRWAEGFSSDVSFIGHSTGAMAGIIANAERPGLIKKMVLFSPAFQVSNAIRLKIKAMTTLGLSGWILGPPIDNERYLSSWAGVQVQKLSDMAANLGSLNAFGANSAGAGSANSTLVNSTDNKFDQVLSALANVETMWIDTEKDKTLDVNRNIELAAKLGESSNSLTYLLVEKKSNIAHDDNGEFNFKENKSHPYYLSVRDFLAVPYF